MMQKLNPNNNANLALEKKADEARKAARAKLLKHKRSKAGRAERAKRTTRFNGVHDDLEQSFKDAHQIILDEIKEGLIDAESEEEGEDDE